MKNVIRFLQERGFVDALTSEELIPLADRPLKLYGGFDPTADSLHLGNLVGIIALAWFQKFGHTAYALVGGATGLIGDPSGRNQERQLLDLETVARNVEGIRKNLEAVLDFDHPNTPAALVNNYDWLKKFSYIDFLRDVGKLFRMGPMLAKESVRTRLESEEGLSYTEFSYQILQAYDFMHLHDEEGVVLQIGGSDQWGNITAGTEFVRKLKGKTVYGLTFPLLTRSDGKKFGKSESGAIWLAPEKLSPYEFYQYFVRLPDADMPKMMRMLTFMELEEIREIERRMSSADYVPNSAQKRLAEEVTRIVHGEQGLQAALRVTQSVVPGATDVVLSGEVLEAIARDMPHCELSRTEIVGSKVIDLFVKAGLVPSKSEARRLIRGGGGIYLNNEKVTSEDQVFTEQQFIDEQWALLALGKKHKCVLHAL
jgi:tyrosyl-tRNA synthetase